MKIAKQGYRFIIAGALVGAGGVALGPWGWGPGALGVCFAAFCAYFFRDPDRALPTDASKIYSPGQGRVLSIAKEGGGSSVTIRIFLSIFDVHVQRNACSGTVEDVTYHKGSFAMAMKPEAVENERSVVRVRPDGREPVIVEQIAGAIARRIETWCKAGDRIAAGERYGIIYFGSQCAVHLPQGARPLVQVGDRVLVGVTPIAQWIA